MTVIDMQSGLDELWDKQKSDTKKLYISLIDFCLKLWYTINADVCCFKLRF